MLTSVELISVALVRPEGLLGEADLDPFPPGAFGSPSGFGLSAVQSKKTRGDRSARLPISIPKLLACSRTTGKTRTSPERNRMRTAASKYCRTTPRSATGWLAAGPEPFAVQPGIQV